MVLAAAAASAFVVASTDTVGDYPTQVGPGIDALAHGNLGRFLQEQPVYGSFSALVRAPFAALGFALGRSDIDVYRLGAFPCLLALGLVSARFAVLGARRGQTALVSIAVLAVTMLNPATLSAVYDGHPEELLAAALALGAVLAAFERRLTLSAVLLGLGLVTKQWALLAFPPVLLLAAGHRVRIALIATGIAAALTLPLAVSDAGRFAANQRMAQGGTPIVSRFSAWWPFSPERTEIVRVGDRAHSITVSRLPTQVTALGRPLAVLVALVLTYLFWRRSSQRAREDVFALLALVLLLRCLLDPNDNAYYHVAFVLSLVAWEALRFRGLPVLTMLSAAALWLTFRSALLDSARLDNAFYLAWTLPMAAWIGATIYAPRALSGLPDRMGGIWRLGSGTRTTIGSPDASAR
jgi:hypothetical protein